MQEMQFDNRVFHRIFMQGDEQHELARAKNVLSGGSRGPTDLFVSIRSPTSLMPSANQQLSTYLEA